MRFYRAAVLFADVQRKKPVCCGNRTGRGGTRCAGMGRPFLRVQIERVPPCACRPYAPRHAGRSAAAQLVFCGNCIESDGTRNGGMERGGKSRGGTEGRGAAFLPMVLQKGSAARRKKTAFFVRRTAAAARKKILLFLIYFKERSASPSCIFAVLRAACRMPSSFPFLAACRIQARCTFLCSSCRPCCTGETPFNSFPTVPPCRTG